MQQKPNLEIMSFIERDILPRYNAFGRSHGLLHVQHVIRNSLELVPLTGADVNMVYVIAAYHDLGMEGPRAIHHITSGKILQADARLRKWFSAEQIKIMKQLRTTEHHRRDNRGASTGKSLPRPTATSTPKRYSQGLYNTDWRTIPRRTRKNNGRGSSATWRRNTPSTAI